jgi:hypothetical protein
LIKIIEKGLKILKFYFSQLQLFLSSLLFGEKKLRKKENKEKKKLAKKL